MSRYTEKKVSYRSKGEVSSRFGFEYNESAINYRTEIPPLPEKPKNKPEGKTMDKKIGDIEGKIKALKETRQGMKEEMKKLNSEYDEEINQYKEQVALGRKCILVLKFDNEIINEEIGRKSGKINRWQTKIDDLIAQIKQLKFKNRPAKKFNKTLEEMNNRELDEEKARIEQTMTTKTLNKREQADLNTRLYKIARVKQEPNRPIAEADQVDDHNYERIKGLESEVSQFRERENKIKAERYTLYQEREENEFKVEDIKEDIKQFFDRLKEIADVVDSSESVIKLGDESRALKENVQKLKSDIVKIKSDFDEKVKEYETEQEKIKWIGWATKIQEKRREEWQDEKNERKKQRIREKNTDKKGKQGEKGAEGDKKDEKQTGKDQKPFFQKKKINRNQKQIDLCSYLVDYCKRLYPSEESDKQQEKKDVNLKDELKKGQWAKLRGVEVIQSKKSKVDDEEEPQKVKYNKKKYQKEEEVVPSNRFSHNYFVAQSFDSVKMLPPSSVEELDTTIKELDDKMEYYLSHPDENVEQKFAKDKQFVQKVNNNEPEKKYTKSRGNQRSVINKEDFPSL